MNTAIPAIIALNNIRSLHNVGSIFRSADAVAVERILLGGLTPTPPRHDLEKTALGATKTVPWEYHRDLQPALSELKGTGYTIYAIEQTPTAKDLFTTTLSFPAVFIFGHERVGVEPDLLACADYHLSLPMRGSSAHSLNVSNCASVVLYEALRQSEAIPV